MADVGDNVILREGPKLHILLYKAYKEVTIYESQ